jgi:hypothetical protein
VVCSWIEDRSHWKIMVEGFSSTYFKVVDIFDRLSSPYFSVCPWWKECHRDASYIRSVDMLIGSDKDLFSFWAKCWWVSESISTSTSSHNFGGKTIDHVWTMLDFQRDHHVWPTMHYFPSQAKTNCSCLLATSLVLPLAPLLQDPIISLPIMLILARSQTARNNSMVEYKRQKNNMTTMTWKKYSNIQQSDKKYEVKVAVGCLPELKGVGFGVTRASTTLGGSVQPTSRCQRIRQHLGPGRISSQILHQWRWKNGHRAQPYTIGVMRTRQRLRSFHPLQSRWENGHCSR